MTDETTFTRIVEGDLPSYPVYEDETTYAFLDANPVAPGHALVIPKARYERLEEVPPDVFADLTAAIRDLLPAIEAAVGADGANVVCNDGAAAGQEIPHVHWHVVPRSEDDGTLVEYHPLADAVGEDEMASIAAAIRDER